MEEQVLTIDVVPQTVTEVIYLNTQDIKLEKTVEVESYYSSSSEEHENEAYEIGCVDATQVEDMPLVYDESESFVMLPGEYQIKQAAEMQIEDSQSSDSDEEFTLPQRPKKVACHVCKMKFSSRKQLFHHRVLHRTNMEKPPYFGDNVQLVYTHPKEINVCKVCGEKFERTQALSIHFRKFHQIIVNKAPEQKQENGEMKKDCNQQKQDNCIQKSKSKDQNSNASSKYFCNICDCPCVNELVLLSHYRKHEPKIFSCDLCEAGYNDENDFINHKKTHESPFLYACNKCDESFPTTALVSYHIRQVHTKNSSKPVVLPVPPEILSMSPEVSPDIDELLSPINPLGDDSHADHSESSNDFEETTKFHKKKHTCNICNMKFRSQGSLMRHKANHMTSFETTSDVNAV